MRLSSACLICFALAACGDWPDLPDPVRQSASGAWPALVPVAELLPDPEAEAQGEEDALQLAARAEALRRRAAVLRTPVGDMDDFDALRARISG
ncbi:hypothetical protein [Silicimonas sp. MF1-12-2]|jgi:hypothetical protein|uniref:hypothetical protein n=1 Tax=Silicimonas sp. MF1-12-2 TaxID=3384793 RepID=UPI0039B3A8DE